jgi:hypothetical protein
VSEDERQYHTGRYNKLIEDCEREIAATFEEYDHFPDRFQADYVKLATNFWKQEPGSDFWSSVFIMTKFPRPARPAPSSCRP